MTQPVPSSFFSPSFRGLIGVARRDITPPVGIYARNWGAAKQDTAEGVHRPLTLTALTLRTEPQSKPLALVDTDLGWWRSIFNEQAFRGKILEKLGLDPSRFIFTLSHTHSAPPLTEPHPDWQGGELLRGYLETLRHATIEAVLNALKSATRATLEWHTGRCQLAANRDLPDPDPTRRRVVCGFHPDADSDDTLLIGRVTDDAGRILATLANYACHPTTLAWDNRLLSPDYIGAMRETIQDHTGGAPAIFLQGASGELAPRYQYVGDPAVADAHGRQLAFAALATLADMEPSGTELAYGGVIESGAPLAIWKRQPRRASDVLRAFHSTVELPLKDWPSAAELERQRHACADRVLEERLRRKRDIRLVLGDGKTFPLPFWVWRMGDAFLVGCMAESYSWLQQHLRRRFVGRAIACMNLVNGSIGYLPPAKSYDADAYQVWQTAFDRGSLEILAAAYERAIETL
ncbi:MAG: alkaline ceramidase [Verrucomicrobia bacterium]|nr:alkaline ceramidase [Verrucomicrobiota bacterium]